MKIFQQFDLAIAQAQEAGFTTPQTIEIIRGIIPSKSQWHEHLAAQAIEFNSVAGDPWKTVYLFKRSRLRKMMAQAIRMMSEEGLNKYIYLSGLCREMRKTGMNDLTEAILATKDVDYIEILWDRYKFLSES